MKLTRYVLNLTLAALIWSALPFSAELGVSGVGAFAAEDEKPKNTRRIPTMSEQTFKKLAEAQEAIDAKDYDTALAVLNGLLDRSKRLNGNEIGQVRNMLGFVYFSKENYAAAIKEYELVVAQGEQIPEGLETTTLYTLAQLCFVEERYQDALDYMETWISKANNPGADPHIFMGQVYYQMKDYPSAIAQIEKGIKIARERDVTVKENWWGLLNYLYFEQENWPKVLEILEILVRDFPKRDYWIRLAGVYGQQGQEKQQVYAMEAAYRGDYLDRQSDLVSLAGLLMQDQAPIRAAAVLKKGIDDGIIEKTARNWQSLGQAYQLAQETDKAIDAYEAAGKLSDDGRIYERLAQLYLDDDQYQPCVTTSDLAIEKGGLRSVQQAYIVKGMCQFNADQSKVSNLTAARKSFVDCRNKARQDEDTSNQRVCQQWITYIDRESQRLEALAQAFE